MVVVVVVVQQTKHAHSEENVTAIGELALSQ